MTILDTIVARKKEEVADRKKTVSITDLTMLPLFNRSTFSLSAILASDEKTGIIAEFKRKSPSKGIINGNASVEQITTAYKQFGAAGISVLTDIDFFGGSDDDFKLARTTVDIPLLRKEFIIDEYQIYEAKALGADVILLIAACLTVAETKHFAAVAKSLGLEVLLEIHDETELGHIAANVDMIGVNNRNLKTFTVDIETSVRLFSHIPSEVVAVTESGIHDTATIQQLKQVGYKGFLIGENFMKQPDPAIAFADFTHQLKSLL
jgi:indole-3-glycerol phosphate synthase